MVLRFNMRFELSTMALAVGLIAPSEVHAQAAPKGTPASADANAPAQEIVITAQKRVENVQTVPIAVTVIGADELDRRGVQGIQDLSQASASLEFTAPSASPGGGGFVRGIGTNLVGGLSAQSSVSVVLDGVVLGNANITDLFDTARVEVLKGPQGTLFGSSVSAGVLNVTTVAPKLGDYSGYINGELALTPLGSEYTRKVMRGAINLPISDNSALRVSAQAYLNDGMTHDAFTGENESYNSYAVRARYLAHFGDNVTFNLIGDYDRMLDDNQSLLTYRAATGPLASALAACGVTPSPDNTESCQGVPTFTHTSVGGVSAQFDVGLGHGVTLTSISSFREREMKQANDIIGIDPDIARQYLAFPNCNFGNCLPVVELITGSGTDPQITRNKLETQELRLASDSNHHFEWVAGLYYQHATTFFDGPARLAVNFGAPVDTVFFDYSAPSWAKVRSTDYAAFGNGTYYIGDATRIIAGLRYTHSKIDESKVDAPNSNSDAEYFGSGRANALTWRAGVQHDFSHNSMVYATVSTGYKAPAINDTLSPTSVDMPAIKPERPTAFEVGIKQSFLNHRIFADFDAFYTNVSNFQTQSCVTGQSGLACTNLNVPSVKSKGLEAEIFGRLARGLTVDLSGIYNIAKYPHNFFGADGSDLSGHQLNYAPKFKVTASIEQEVPLTADYALVFGGDVTHRSPQSMYLSANPTFVVPGTTMFNARLTLKSKDRWSISLFGRNLTNKTYPTQIYPTNAFAQGGYWQVLDNNSRRTVGFQFEAKF